MHSDPLVFSLFVIFAGAALFAALALFAGQSLLIAYIVLGCVVGPWGLGLIEDPKTIASVGHVGIIFLLFLLGLNMHPQKLLRMLGEAVFVTAVSSTLFALVGAAIATLFGFGVRDACLIGACMMFSSTIIGLKLLPTTALHHRHLGEVIIAVLLLQDLVAIVLLLVVQAMGQESLSALQALKIAVAPALLAGVAYLAAKRVLLPLMQRFDTIQEYLFLAAVGWCLAVAQLGHALELSYEMGAFIAGVALATNPVSTFIAESLKPLRDFFLIMFFFSLGAGFDLSRLSDVAVVAMVLGASMLLLKPWAFRKVLRREQEKIGLAAEAGARLGQISEFSLLVSALALSSGVMSDTAAYAVQAATMITFFLSSYWIVARYPTPIAINARLRRD
ncbi:MAG: Kef-type K+ transport system membrane component KefB [Gammaproteobacteria bacterium]|jgi:Kef-type K+ transport system membrane component KefB